jgi:hypothetical protein
VENVGIDRQSQSHVHVSGPVAVADIAGCSARDTVAPAVLDGCGEPVAAAAGAFFVAASKPAPTAVAAATFTCVTRPLSPGLCTRMLTFTLVGETWTATMSFAVGTGSLAVGAVGGSDAVSAVVSGSGGVVSALEGASAGASTGASTGPSPPAGVAGASVASLSATAAGASSGSSARTPSSASGATAIGSTTSTTPSTELETSTGGIVTPVTTGPGPAPPSARATDGLAATVNPAIRAHAAAPLRARSLTSTLTYWHLCIVSAISILHS